MSENQWVAPVAHWVEMIFTLNKAYNKVFKIMREISFPSGIRFELCVQISGLDYDVVQTD